jgi:uncharacterized membrane protein
MYKKSSFSKTIISIIITVIFSVILFSCSKQEDSYKQSQYIEAKVLKIVSGIRFKDEQTKYESGQAKIMVKILSGEDIDKEVLITQDLTQSNMGLPEVNSTVILSESLVGEDTSALQIVDVKRNHVTLLAIALFIICLGAIGGLKGLIFFSILASLFLITFYILFPLIAYGFSPVILTFGFSAFIITIINFLTSKSKENMNLTLISNLISLTVVTIFAYFFAKMGSFSSLIYKESGEFVSASIRTGGFIASAIILTSLGGIINVSSTTFNTASNIMRKNSKNKVKFSKIAYDTLKYVRPSIFINFLFIFLIYLGLSLPILMAKSYSVSVQSIINADTISFYLIAVSIGGLGLITSGLASIFMSSLKK